MEKYVITIARTFGSGGRQIALSLGDSLGIHCYDKEILDLVAQESGMDKDFINSRDEKMTGHLLERAFKMIPTRDIITADEKKFVSDVNLYNLQSKLIFGLADKGPCIIVGRCADFVLEEYPNVFRFFIDAPKDYRVATVAERFNLDKAEAEKLENKTNRYRKDYYEYYTGRGWKDPSNYDIMFNSSKTGWGEIITIIEDYISYKSSKN